MSDGTGRYAVPSHAASLLDVRAKRREAYQSQRSGWGSCGRRYGAAFFLVDVVLCPVFALFSVHLGRRFRQLLRLWWKSFTAWLSCMDCHFFLGALAAVLLCAWTAWQSCDAPEPHLERHLRLVCSFESPLASQAWELLKSTSSSLTLHWVWFVASLQEIEHRVALLLLQGRCPSRFGVATPCPRLPCFAQSLPRWSATSTSRPLTLAASGLCGRAASGLQRGIEPRLRYAAPRAELPGRAVKKVVETTP
ncbi:unnamed protein product [Durusdinium trenchii]|uniref:Uncharacterized protein n=1 Tax=Durusdinium trenchii TaxID=1381693 RepID=A0ABP0SBV2_9DINO